LNAALARESGFLLVEVLVAMVVVAVGILALAGLLQASTRHSKLGQLRVTATLLAHDIADRIRANPAGGYELTDPAFPTATRPRPAPCTNAAPCEPAALAALDLADWTSRVRTTLPGGSAWIQGRREAPPAPGIVDVWVAWSDPLTGAPGRASEGAAVTCPDAWRTIESPVRCVHLQVAP